MSNLDKSKRSVKTRLGSKKPGNRLYSTESLDVYAALSAERLELMGVLNQYGPLSRRQLSIKLNRAYANVQEDVNALLPFELIKENSKQKLFAPWDEICYTMK